MKVTLIANLYPLNKCTALARTLLYPIIVLAQATFAFLKMKDCCQSHIYENPGMQLSNMRCFPVTYKWADTKDQRWSYKRASGALGIPSWTKMDLYLGRNNIITWSVRPGLWGPRMLIKVFLINIIKPWHLIYFKGFLLADVIHINCVMKYTGSGVKSIRQTNGAWQFDIVRFHASEFYESMAFFSTTRFCISLIWQNVTASSCNTITTYNLGHRAITQERIKGLATHITAP